MHDKAEYLRPFAVDLFDAVWSSPCLSVECHGVRSVWVNDGSQSRTAERFVARDFLELLCSRCRVLARIERVRGTRSGAEPADPRAIAALDVRTDWKAAFFPAFGKMVHALRSIVNKSLHQRERLKGDDPRFAPETFEMLREAIDDAANAEALGAHFGLCTMPRFVGFGVVVVEGDAKPDKLLDPEDLDDSDATGLLT